MLPSTLRSGHLFEDNDATEGHEQTRGRSLRPLYSNDLLTTLPYHPPSISRVRNSADAVPLD